MNFLLILDQRFEILQAHSGCGVGSVDVDGAGERVDGGAGAAV